MTGTSVVGSSEGNTVVGSSEETSEGWAVGSVTEGKTVVEISGSSAVDTEGNTGSGVVSGVVPDVVISGIRVVSGWSKEVDVSGKKDSILETLGSVVRDTGTKVGLLVSVTGITGITTVVSATASGEVETGEGEVVSFGNTDSEVGDGSIVEDSVIGSLATVVELFSGRIVDDPMIGRSTIIKVSVGSGVLVMTPVE